MAEDKYFIYCMIFLLNLLNILIDSKVISGEQVEWWSNMPV
jgi:hypothetical protein